MPTFGKLFKHLSIESRNVVRLPARNQSVIDDYVTIDPFGACIDQVGLQRWPRCNLSFFDNFSLNQSPRCMTNGGHWLARCKETSHKFNGSGHCSELIRIPNATRQY